MKFKKEYIFYILPLMIALLRLIHLYLTGYIIPDESNYSSMSIIYHETGKKMVHK